MCHSDNGTTASWLITAIYNSHKVPTSYIAYITSAGVPVQSDMGGAYTMSVLINCQLCNNRSVLRLMPDNQVFKTRYACIDEFTNVTTVCEQRYSTINA